MSEHFVRRSTRTVRPVYPEGLDWRIDAPFSPPVRPRAPSPPPHLVYDFSRSGSSRTYSTPSPTTPEPNVLLLAPKRSSHVRRRKDGHIPRPQNCFMLFRSDFWAKQRVTSNACNDHRKISKIAGAVWRALPAEEKAVYERRAKELAILHAQMYPNYKYSPGSNASKSKAKRKVKKNPDDDRKSQLMASYVIRGIEGEALDRVMEQAEETMAQPGAQPSPQTFAPSQPQPSTPSSSSRARKAREPRTARKAKSRAPVAGASPTASTSKVEITPRRLRPLRHRTATPPLAHPVAEDETQSSDRQPDDPEIKTEPTSEQVDISANPRPEHPRPEQQYPRPLPWESSKPSLLGEYSASYLDADSISLFETPDMYAFWDDLNTSEPLPLHGASGSNPSPSHVDQPTSNSFSYGYGGPFSFTSSFDEEEQLFSQCFSF